MELRKKGDVGSPANGDSVLRTVLESKRIQIEQVLRRRDGIAIEKSPDQSDEIQSAYERDIAIGNLDRESGRLREVIAALRRIDDGAFGACVRCGGMIDVKRLAALPWASCCLPCQADADREVSTRGNGAPLLDGD